jgi:hypothetical protein
MDPIKVWKAARAGDGRAIEVDGITVPVEVVAALRALPSPDAEGKIITFGLAPDRRLVERDGVAILKIVRAA